MSGLAGIYIGDGVHVEYDEPLTQWWLRTNRAEGVHEIALGPGELLRLIGLAGADLPEFADALLTAFAAYERAKS